MDVIEVTDVLRQTCITAAVLAAPALIAALLIGSLMSLLQTVTQVQDQAISFVPKLIVVGLVVFAMMPWMADYYVQYAQDALTQIPSLVFGG